MDKSEASIKSWHHFVAALKDAHNRDAEFGVQFTEFRVGDGVSYRRTLHVAIVSEDGYWQRADANGEFIEKDGYYRLWCIAPKFSLELKFITKGSMEHYSLDGHCGDPRVRVSGWLNMGGKWVDVEGSGCIDIEAFQNKLHPGETGWQWQIAWLDNDQTIIDYSYTGPNARPPWHYGDKADLVFARIGPEQEWKKGEHLAFPYTEELCHVHGVTVDGEVVRGRGYREIVSLDGNITI